MKLIAQTTFAFLCLVAAFAGGYVARPYGPSIPEILDELGLRSPAWAGELREEPRQQRGTMNPREALALLGSYTSEINSRIEDLEDRRKEKDVAIRLLTNRGEKPDSRVLRRLGEEQETFDRQIARLHEMREDALDVEARLQRFVDAEADVEGAMVRDQESLTDARAVLARLESLGGWTR